VGGALWSEHSGGGANQEVLVTGGQAQLTFSRSEDVDAALTNAPYTPISGAVLYSSFTVTFAALPNSSGSYIAHFNASANHHALVWASTSGAQSGLFRLGIGNTTAASAGTGQLTNELSLTTTYIVVTRYNVATGSSTLWLNPSSETDFSVTATDTTSTNNVSAYSMRQATGMGTLTLDNLKVGTSFADVLQTNLPPVITAQPQSQTTVVGSNVTFTVSVTGSPPFTYQWKLNSTNLAGATSSILSLTNVTLAQSGTYSVAITNGVGFTNSQAAILTVNEPLAAVSGFSLVQYNLKGNFASDWSTNAAQVQAIARELLYLNPDIITFNEFQNGARDEITNWQNAFFSNYTFLVSPGGDGVICNGIASRFPVTRYTNWFDNASLTNFGYNGIFTRDMFEAQIAVPGFPQPLHVFSVHLKSGNDSVTDTPRRAAEARVISNFFANGWLTTNGLRPYILTGDMNEDIAHPDAGSGLPIQTMTNGTGFRLTTPLNPFTLSNVTHSIQGVLDRRYDYILPNTLLYSNIASSMVFRTDLLNPVPPNLNSNDDMVASDHLPVKMVFNNPYDKPFRVLALARSNQTATLTWQSVLGQPYRVDSSSNLTTWSPFASNLVATSNTFTLTMNVAGNIRFFRVYRAP
jgi:endonuclease/exonuclease/phosphatase family metal-dependent hydrolase